MTDYKVVFSKRKTLALEVNKDLEVIVRAPLFVSKYKIESFVLSHLDWIDKAKLRVKQRKDKSPFENLSDEKINELKEKAKEMLPKRVEYYSQILKLYPSSLKITSAKTRFGSCSGKNSICFSLFLMLYPDEAIDYVVVHELCHIKHKNHGKQFYKLIESVMPDYKERNKLLKIKNG